MGVMLTIVFDAMELRIFSGMMVCFHFELGGQHLYRCFAHTNAPLQGANDKFEPGGESNSKLEGLALSEALS